MASATDASKYLLNHTMLRVKDPQASVKFYEFLGMKQVHKEDFPESSFALYFLAYNAPQTSEPPPHWSARQGVLELTHNYGPDDANFEAANGNADPGRGFGHICISVDHIQAACKRLEDAGFKFHKKLTDGRMRHIAFALDPDGYWVEIIGQKKAHETEDIEETTVETYKFNHSMIRVKDASASLAFYRETLGMDLLRTSRNFDHNFTLFFLAYPAGDGAPLQAHREGILELTWNHGTEKDPNFKYHNGNSNPRGFGHICISVDNLEAACKRFEAEEVAWQKRLTDGKMKTVAFISDPDGYWVEVIQNENLRKGS